MADAGNTNVLFSKESITHTLLNTSTAIPPSSSSSIRVYADRGRDIKILLVASYTVAVDTYQEETVPVVLTYPISRSPYVNHRLLKLSTATYPGLVIPVIALINVPVELYNCNEPPESVVL